MPSVLRTLNYIYGYTATFLGFLSAALLAVPLALLEPLRYLGTVPHAVLICLRDVLVELGWKPIMVMLWAANIQMSISRPDSYCFPGEGGWLPDRAKRRKFVVNANHQNLGDTLLIAYLLNSLNATNGSGMWTIWETYRKIPLLWASGLAGHLFLSKRTLVDKVDLTSFERDKFSHLLFYAEGGCRDAAAQLKAKQYAAQHGMVCPKHTLIPRAGFLHMVLPDLHAAGVRDLVDLTIAYPPGCDALKNKFGLTEFGTLKDKPYEVHVHIRTLPLMAPGLTLQEVQANLNDIYREKDVLLEQFITSGCFPDAEPIIVPIRWWGFQVLAWLTLLYFILCFLMKAAAFVLEVGWRHSSALFVCILMLIGIWWNRRMCEKYLVAL